GEIYAERLFFIHPKEEELIAVKVKTDKELYEPLEEIKVTLQIASKTISSDYNFSLSVRDRNNGVEVSSVDNIATYLLLSSDLRGFIEDPSFYFQDESYSRVMSLDLLLMVQGWRRYDWLSMSGIKPFEKRYSTEYQLIIEGHVASSSKIDMEVKARMDNGDTLYMETSTWTDENKRFCFLPEDFYGTWNIALRCGQVKEANKDIRLDRWFSPRPKTYSPLEKIWRKKVSLRDGESLLSRRLGEEKGNISILLSEVNVSARRGKDRTFHVNREVDKLIDQGKKVPVSVHDYLSDVDYNYSYESASYFLEPGAGNYLHYNEDKMSFVEKIGRESVVSRNDFVDRWDIQNPKKLNSDNAIVDHTNTNSSNIILRKLNYDDPENYRTDPFTVENGIYFYKKPTQAVFFYLENDQWKTKSSERLRTSKSTYGVSNHELTSKRILKEVDKIVIFGSHKRDIYGSPFTPIYIYPLKNFMLRVLPGTRYTTFDGYSKPKEFYVNQINSDLAKPAINYEYHRTLYWNPDMEINEDGSASVSFYNNAVTRNIEVSAEGITNDGFFMSNELKGE
ncbi:hypothetical protein LJB92_04600, partial [Bacteroidales bacterium OttesenSCG-928-M06]|nr:hypothetical protein [Bacteroidales bacterium OttesenSCG-928-M06]